MSDTTADAVLIATAIERIDIFGKVSAVAVARHHSVDPSVVFRALSSDARLRQDKGTREWLRA